MNKYTITFEINHDMRRGNDFIESILAEIKEDKRQLKLCNEINKHTSILHQEVLKKDIEDINNVLREIGIEFSEPIFMAENTNSYRGSISHGIINGEELSIVRQQTSTSVVEGIKYSTFEGKPGLFYSVRRGGNTYAIESIDHILESWRDKIKAEILSR